MADAALLMDNDTEFGSSVHYVDTCSDADDSMESVVGHRGSPRPSLSSKYDHGVLNVSAVSR